jgi:hypothetical protein
MKIYHLPKPTEQDLQQEVAEFIQANINYHESLYMLRQKRQGYWPMFTRSEIQQYVDENFRQAYQKIPTLWLVELQELLNQKNITIC